MRCLAQCILNGLDRDVADRIARRIEIARGSTLACAGAQRFALSQTPRSGPAGIDDAARRGGDGKGQAVALGPAPSSGAPAGETRAGASRRPAFSARPGRCRAVLAASFVTPPASPP